MKELKTDSLFRVMRIIVFYDLPTTTKADISISSKFRTELLKRGFLMLQESIYIKQCLNHDWVNRTMISLEGIVPKKGDVRILKITEKQYEEIVILSGKKSLKEQYNNFNSLVVI
ncbi:MAG: CRISPR-associated endonuclease Cas2 [Mycoplasmataceae bacterium]|nr:CRISPR-associated endonuclease Cas2 [Mycoplasmataceae bacterium]